MYHPSKDTLDIMFEACVTYEPGQLEPNDFPLSSLDKSSNSHVWILGKLHVLPDELDALRQDVSSRLWFTYRKGFQPIGDTNHTSDRGWGCMLRCGQMILAETLLRYRLGRDWICNEEVCPPYLRILKMFEDKRSAIYSIHQIAQMGVSEGKQIGQWFGPNTIGHVLRRLCAYDRWNDIRLHVAMDSNLVISDVAAIATTPIEDLAELIDTGKEGSRRLTTWRPVLIIIPLRVGMHEVNDVYVPSLKACFELEHSVGMIGGKPNQALYFIGYVGDEVVFLDPHVCQPCAFVEETEAFDDSSYHCQASGRLPILAMDPSIALCFFCKDEEDFTQLCQDLRQRVLETSTTPLFEINAKRTLGTEQLSFRSVSIRTPSPYTSDKEGASYNTGSDDDFELIE